MWDDGKKGGVSKYRRQTPHYKFVLQKIKDKFIISISEKSSEGILLCSSLNEITTKYLKFFNQ